MVTCTTQPSGPASGVHPVSLHPLDESQCCHGNFAVFIPKLQQLGEAGNIQTWIWCVGGAGEGVGGRQEEYMG